MKHVSAITRALLLVSFVVLVQPQTVWSGDDGKQKEHQARTSSSASKSLNEELAAMRTKVAQLEAALKETHQGQMQTATAKAMAKKKGMKAKGGMDAGMKGMSGMGGMKPGKKMGMGMKSGKKMGMGMMSAKGKKMGMMSGKKKGMGMMGGKGMGMMGRMPKMARMAMPSALPGFPGASHIYHIGSTGFFLDHGEHITPSQEQTTKLNQHKEKTLLRQATFTRQTEEAEQALWILTGSDKPDAAKIEAQVRKIAKLQGDQRIAFIRAIGEAATVLTADQRQKLMGEHIAKDNQAVPADSNE